jgi:hypothetical protein
MTPRSAADDADGWRKPDVAGDADGRLRRLSAEDWDALAVRKAMDVFRDPDATGLQRWAAQEVLLDAGILGVWQGGMSVEGSIGPHRPELVTEWDSQIGRLRATADFDYKGQHYRKGDVVPGEAIEGYIRYDEPSGEARRRVVRPIEGLYESIPTDKDAISKVLPEGWRIVGETSYLDDPRFKFIETMVEFTDPETGEVARGIFQRGYYPETGTLELKAAYLRDPRLSGEGELPSWIDIGTSFPGKEGVPTAAFFTMYQMRRMGVPYGGLERVAWDNVENADTLLHIDWLGRKHSQASLESLVAHTHSVRYAETALTQSGHEIVPGSFEVKLPGYGPSITFDRTLTIA